MRYAGLSETFTKHYIVASSGCLYIISLGKMIEQRHNLSSADYAGMSLSPALVAIKFKAPRHQHDP
jgi:hypothetical protein